MDVTITAQLMELLKAGGPWGLCALLIVAVVTLFRRYEQCQKDRLGDAKEIRDCVQDVREIAQIMKDWINRER